MSEDLEGYVRKAESEIDDRTRSDETTTRHQQKRLRLPRSSFAFTLWIAVVVLGAFQFDTVISLVMSPAESRIEEDLSQVLRNAAGAINRYEDSYGELPMLLPNPAIRGLVEYERVSEYSYRLSATIHTVTMVLDSSSTMPHREDRE